MISPEILERKTYLTVKLLSWMLCAFYARVFVKWSSVIVAHISLDGKKNLIDEWMINQVRIKNRI